MSCKVNSEEYYTMSILMLVSAWMWSKASGAHWELMNNSFVLVREQLSA